MGRFTYTTYNQSDFDALNDRYHYSANFANVGFGKPNSTANAHPVTRDWTTRSLGLWAGRGR